MGNKVCAECKIDQAVSCFYRDKTRLGGYARVCKSCAKAYAQRRWHENHEENKARSRMRGADYRKRNPEYDRLKYIANRDRMLAQSAAWKLAHPERMAQFKKDWQARHPERYADQKRANESKRRARKAAVEVFEFSDEQLTARLAYYGHKCWICNTCDYEELDHVKPLSKGGAHMLGNLRPACRSCNRSKHASWPFRAVAA